METEESRRWKERESDSGGRREKPWRVAELREKQHRDEKMGVEDVETGRWDLRAKEIGRRVERVGDKTGDPEPPDVSVDFRETSFPRNASTFKPRIDSDLGGTYQLAVLSS